MPQLTAWLLSENFVESLAACEWSRTISLQQEPGSMTESDSGTQHWLQARRCIAFPQSSMIVMQYLTYLTAVVFIKPC